MVAPCSTINFQENYYLLRNKGFIMETETPTLGYYSSIYKKAKWRMSIYMEEYIRVFAVWCNESL